MNKYLVIGIALVALLGGGFVYKTYFVAEEDRAVTTGIVKEFTITAKKNEWRFTPDVIEVDQGDKIILTVRNEDEYDHGFAIDAFGISQRMPANATIKIEFVATQEGTYPFYCSVPCGSGEVDGKERGHLDQVGKILVQPAIRAAQ